MREYWVLDPKTLRHRFYALDGEVFVEFAEQEEMEWIDFQVIPGFKVKRSRLNPAALAPVCECLEAID